MENISWSGKIMFHIDFIKEEIQNRFDLISEERVKKFEQNSENLLMKIG